MMKYLTLVQKYKIETYKNLSKGITEIANYHCRDKSVFLSEMQMEEVISAKLIWPIVKPTKDYKITVRLVSSNLKLNGIHDFKQDYNP